MRRPLLGYILLIIAALSLVYAFLLSRQSTATFTEILPFVIGLLCIVVLWYWMFFNLIANRKKIKHPIWWGFFLLFANWIAAIVYFFVKYAPAEKNALSSISKWISQGNSYRDFYAKIAVVSLAATIFHYFFTDLLYKTINLYDYPIYQNIIGVIYFPLRAFLLLISRILTINTEHPTENALLFAQTLRLIYTYCLFFVIATALFISGKRKYRNS